MAKYSSGPSLPCAATGRTDFGKPRIRWRWKKQASSAPDGQRSTLSGRPAIPGSTCSATAR